MKIAFIAPFPPPLTGHSLVSKEFFEFLKLKHEVRVVDMGKTSFGAGVTSLARIGEVLGILFKAWRRQRNVQAVYLTLSESMAGNIKDLLILLACCPDLSRVYLHLHGGTLGEGLWGRHPWLRWINRLFYRRVGGVIISGEAHRRVFQGMLDDGRIHIVPNFAPDHLFIGQASLVRKYASLQPLKVLFLSGMQPEKGYGLLLQAYLALPDDLRSRVRLDFAGRFDTPAQETRFREQIAGLPGVAYHGLVDEARKVRLFEEAHILCLPTRLREGQPITILEAYAAGCAVVTTGQPGIRDIFTGGVNGLEIDPDQRGALTEALAGLIRTPGPIPSWASTNRAFAERNCRRDLYQSRLSAIVEAGSTP